MGRWLPAIDNDGKISAFQVFFFRASWNFGMNVWFFFFFFSFFLFGLQVTGYVSCIRLFVDLLLGVLKFFE